MIVQLGGGLDLVTAKTHAAPGTLQDCMNFEVAFTQGYRRIDGFLRYDGRAVPGSIQLYTLRAEYATGEQIVSGLPLYETSGSVGVGIWPPEAFDKIIVGDEVKFQAIKGFVRIDQIGLTVEWNEPITGYVIDIPNFVEVAGTSADDVDLSNRTGLIFFDGDPSAEGNIIAPNIDPRFYGSKVITDIKGRFTSFDEGFGGDLIVGTPPGTFGVFNNEPKSQLVDLTDPTNGLSWESYNQAWKQNLDAYRQTVTEFPGGTALGMTYYRDTLYSVAETTSWNYTLHALFLSSNIQPRQWAYFQRENVIANTGPLGTTNPRSVLQGDLQSCRVMQIKDGRIELLMPALDPALPTEGQDPEGRGLFLLTEIVFWKDGVFPQAGDELDDGSGNTAQVMFVSRDATDPDIPTEWNGFTDSGVMLVQHDGPDPNWDKDTVLSITGKSGNLTVYRAFGTSGPNAVVTIGTLEDTDQAVVVRSTDFSGFYPIDMGYEVQFFNGQNAIRDVYTQGGFGDDPETVDFATGDTPVEEAEWRAYGGADVTFAGDVDDIREVDANFMSANFNTVASDRREIGLRVSDFDLEVPRGTLIRGIELTVRARTQRGDTDAILAGVIATGSGGTGVGTKVVQQSLTGAYVNYVIGADDDDWTLRGLSPENINNLIFRINFRLDGAANGNTDFEVDYVGLTVHYSDKRTTTVYLNDGLNDVAAAELIYTHIDEGSFANDDAKGVMTMRLLEPDGVTPATQATIDSIVGSLDIRTQDKGGGVIVADTYSDTGANPIRLPGLASMQAEDSRYQFIHRNFFATDFLDAVYGVNGAGPAFTFNDNYFIRIRTGIGEEKNKPRHVEDFASSLVLGYKTGEFNVSVPNEPLDFSGENGAIADGVGEKITGLLELQGTTLAVFTEKKIIGYQVAGIGLQPITLSPSTGAIEYTVVDMGMPIYCDFRGVATISTSEKYGDFDRGRFSYNVSRWLTPRLQGVREEGSIASDPDTRDIESQYGVAGVLLVRNKNQYRVIFNDGYVLTMTLLGDTPEFTIQRYWTERDDAGELKYQPEPMQLWATEFGTTSTGQDRIFVSALNYQFVLEMDRGNNFDGLAIDSYLVANIMNFQSPGINKRYNIIHYHGLVGGYANFTQSFGVDYAEPDPDAHSSAVKLGDEDNNWYRGPRPAFAKARTDSRGRDITIRIDHTSDIEAPFTLQTLEWLDVSPRRPER